MIGRKILGPGFWFFVLATANLFAGGSGLNIVVVVNTNSSDSLQLGNYYCEKREVPPQNVLRIGWTGPNTNWVRADFEARLRAPLETMLAERQLSNQIEYVLLSMDIPYRVYDGGDELTRGTNSTTSALFYGFKPDGCITNCPAGYPSCTLGSDAANAYAGSEGLFRQISPGGAVSNSWLTMMLTSSNLAQAKSVVDRSVVSDFSFPTQNVYLIHYEVDPIRGVRHYQYDDAIFENRVRGAARVTRADAGSPNALGHQFGSQFGLSSFNLSPGLFAPGALADNLTSFGGYLFENFGHVTALRYLNAGATASYGTVVEPCNYLEKFPSPRNYFYQARGFNAAECYYQSLTNPYQGILVGEPLAAPFAVPGQGNWINLPAGAILTGTTNLSLEFNAPDAGRPVGQVDLFVNGNLVRTLTNFAPQPDNELYVTINGFPTNYTVPPDATLQSIASSLTAQLNAPDYSNATKIAALAHGDRIELRSLDLAAPGDQLSVSVSNHIGAASLLRAGIVANRTNFLDTAAHGFRNFIVTNAVLSNSFLQLTVTKTNGSVVTISVTNSPTNTVTATLVQLLHAAVNTNAALALEDGAAAVDFFSHTPFEGQAGEFNLRARSPGWTETLITANLSGSAELLIIPDGDQRLDQNVTDLQPRNHLYLTSGQTNLPLTFEFDTTTLADGFHELTAVAYEGTHVRTQTRVSQNVRIQNSSLAAVFACLLCDTNTALEATLEFAVTANTNNISRIELFSTGGAWGAVSNEPATTFSLAATNLGAGRHPFYALVTRTNGQQYRTETKWIRLISSETPFPLAIAGEAPTLAWPATAGRRYEVLSTTNAGHAFVLRDSVVPTNSPGRWSETNNSATEQYYRVRSAP